MGLELRVLTEYGGQDRGRCVLLMKYDVKGQRGRKKVSVPAGLISAYSSAQGAARKPYGMAAWELGKLEKVGTTWKENTTHTTPYMYFTQNTTLCR